MCILKGVSLLFLNVFFTALFSFVNILVVVVFLGEIFCMKNCCYPKVMPTPLFY